MPYIIILKSESFISLLLQAILAQQGKNLQGMIQLLSACIARATNVVNFPNIRLNKDYQVPTAV